MNPSKSPINFPTVRFVGLFLLFVLIFTFLIQSSWIDEKVLFPYTKFIASISAWTLSLAGIPVETQDTVIRESHFAVDIRKGCDGVVATTLLVSACLAYPVTWRYRFWGTLVGYALVFTLNLIRIVGLFAVGSRGSAEVFNFFHTYVSQFLVIALTMVFWVFWAGRQKTIRL